MRRRLRTGEVRAFQKTVRRHARRMGRTFAWRQTRDPYRILVSEIMLQQTQTHRVEPKYSAFIERFPSSVVLAQASLVRVYALWQGLGYNRRARLLRDAARHIVAHHDGRVPCTVNALRELPGVGPYTAGAVSVFAFGRRVPLIETNIRAVYLHHFFPRMRGVGDEALMPLIEATMPARNIRAWYNALMDYGAYLKQIQLNPNRRSKHHARQGAFKGSMREVRGAIMRAALACGVLSRADIARHTGYVQARIEPALAGLVREGSITERPRGRYRLAD